VPTQAWRLVDHPNLHDYDLSTLNSIGGGSSFWPPALIARLREELPHVAVGTGYGMTETNGGGTSHGGAAMAAHPEAVGTASPLGTIKAIGADGETLPEGEVGEVCMRSACTFLGYWQNPEATGAAIDSDGWYHTGDFGRVEHDLLFLDGRRRDLIIRGGENIYPREIEQRLVEHPEVEDVAVIGVPHQVLGAEVKAFVVLRAGSTLDEAAIKAFVGQALASFKVPAYIEIRDSLPYNATGKVLKHLLEAGGTSDFIEE
jgi:acyl-CoA synthetase (AMP-forming)/AMP-acid ligase II